MLPHCASPCFLHYTGLRERYRLERPLQASERAEKKAQDYNCGTWANLGSQGGGGAPAPATGNGTAERRPAGLYTEPSVPFTDSGSNLC